MSVVQDILRPGSMIDDGVLNFKSGTFNQVDPNQTLNFKAAASPISGVNLMTFQKNDATVLSNITNDGQIVGAAGVATKVKAGVVADSDYTFAPVSGSVAVDTTNSKLMVRVGTSWLRTAALT